MPRKSTHGTILEVGVSRAATSRALSVCFASWGGGAFHDGDLERAFVVGGNATVFGDGGTGGRTGAADGGRGACKALTVPAG